MPEPTAVETLKALLPLWTRARTEPAMHRPAHEYRLGIAVSNVDLPGIVAEFERLDELLHGIPFVHGGRDLTHHFIADGTTDMLRRLAKALEPQYGRDWGTPPVTLENLADDCDLLAAHNVQLRADVKRLKAFADSLVARLATQTAAAPQPETPP